MGIFKSDEDESRKSKPRTRKVLPLLPLRDIVVYPHMVVPLYVGRQKSIAAVTEARNGDGHLLLAAQRQIAQEEPGEGDIHAIGTIGLILQHVPLPDGTVKVIVEGKQRARIRSFVQPAPFFCCDVEPIEDGDVRGVETEALMRSIRSSFEKYVKLNRKIPPELLNSLAQIQSASRLADTVAAHLSLKLEDRQRVLEIEAAAERLEEVYGLLQGEIEVLEVEGKIRTRVKKQMERSQKEYYLNEQMRAIQKELGERDEFKNEIQELEAALAKKKLPKDALDARQEGDPQAQDDVADERRGDRRAQLRRLDPGAARGTSTRTRRRTSSRPSACSNEDHYGLEKPKERILEYLAVQTLVEKLKGPILCLVGPPGVGKTSLGKSIAHATGRDFVRVSLGGVRDEAEIRGHRRTYIGALPGKVLQSLRKAGSSNPVFLLDEVDKMSMDFRGDPSAALLEVLDPEQNHTFGDHYLDIDYDLSRVMFVCTANVLHQIPRPLQDRMEIIQLPGYIESEKLEIARNFLVPKVDRGERPRAAPPRVHRRRPARRDPPLHARVRRAQSRARAGLDLPQGRARGREGRRRRRRRSAA